MRLSQGTAFSIQSLLNERGRETENDNAKPATV